MEGDQRGMVSKVFDVFEGMIGTSIMLLMMNLV